MASRRPSEGQKKAQPGEVLLVVHHFDARSADELSLSKGDKIELIERDDDFGDGWYLGRHLSSGMTGLFPEVYTTIIARPNNLVSIKSNLTESAFPAKASNTHSAIPKSMPASDSTSKEERSNTQASGLSISTGLGPYPPAPPPLYTPMASQKTNSLPPGVLQSQLINPPLSQRSISMTMASTRRQGEESPVMNETLSVIDEHITDLNAPRSSILGAERPGLNDSGSEYSSYVDRRLSYINGHETDEEEQNTHTEVAVSAWTPLQVAEYLAEVGVENRHCEVFKEQEITGEVLLGMDQSSIFIKEFELGLVGQRLRTWHKIKALQEEVRENKLQNMVSSKASREGDDSSQDLERSISSTGLRGSASPRIPSLADRSIRSQIGTPPRSESPRTPQEGFSQLRIPRRESGPPSNNKPGPDSPRRPSAASVRELNHSRRHSSMDTGLSSLSTPKIEEDSPVSSRRSIASPHKKAPSFDRNWTMSSVPSWDSRPASALGTRNHSLSLSTDRNTFDPGPQEPSFAISPLRDIDRGYLSDREGESKKSRKVLKKREVFSASHSRQSSFMDDFRRENPKRHSRFGSADSFRDAVASLTSPASKIYYGNGIKGRHRSLSAKQSSSPANLMKDTSSPMVTKLDYQDTPETSIHFPSPRSESEATFTKQSSPTLGTKSGNPFPRQRMSIRAISDAITDTEKSLVVSPVSTDQKIKESPIQSPTRTGSTATSGASKSIELERPDVSLKGLNKVISGNTSSTNSRRRKSKKDTSAYTRGLEPKTPQEQMQQCDYSGWMKKKSSNLMTTWKSRLFVLRGRRLSYFYSENDTEEKGLIDISSHRVLPADHDRLTGLHATVTGAKASPTSPSNAHTATLNSTEAASQSSLLHAKSGVDSMFIFKLVPPRTGLSRAVNFTKPTVHYFAVDNVQLGRLWMAALMKATIDRDHTSPITSTYQQKTISLAKARALRHRPPALMGLDEKVEKVEEAPKSDETGLNIQGINYGDEKNGTEGHKRSTSDFPPTSLSGPASAPLAEAKPDKTAETVKTTETRGEMVSTETTQTTETAGTMETVGITDTTGTTETVGTTEATEAVGIMETTETT